MNAEGRKKLTELQSQLSAIKSDIEDIQGEEQEKYDNMPENMQSGDKGTKLEEIIGALEEAANSCQEASDKLDEATEQ